LKRILDFPTELRFSFWPPWIPCSRRNRVVRRWMNGSKKSLTTPMAWA
jgi:hypothetical protein